MAAQPDITTITSITLLDGLTDPENHEAWRRFAERYRPVIVAFGRRLGLSESDAQDVAQEAMLIFVTAYRDGRYDRNKGRLRSWLFGITQNATRNHTRKYRRERVMADQSDATAFLCTVPDQTDELQQQWDREWRKAILKACFDEVRKDVAPETFRAFEEYVLNQQPAELVASKLGMTTNSVYLAKNRIMNRVRKIRPQIEQVW